MFCDTHIKIWNLANHMEKMKQKHQTLSFQFFINKSSILMLFVLYFFMWLANFNMWTAKHLVQASCTEFTLTYLKSANKFWKIAQAMFLSWTDFSCYSISCTCQAGETFSGMYNCTYLVVGILPSRSSFIQSYYEVGSRFSRISKLASK